MRGLAVPISGQGGRIATVSGEDQLRKIIILNLSDCDSANPFQDLGLGSEIIFDIDSPATQGRIRARIMQVFQRLEQADRARLSPGYPIFRSDPDRQELVADVRYVNLETTDEEELAVSYATALSGVARMGGL